MEGLDMGWITNTSEPWIQTFDGRAVSLVDPLPSDIKLSTIAIVLSRMCRFGGHCRKFYSVAEHSYRVCRIVASETVDIQLRLAALLHDAHEAYTGFGDVCRPARIFAPLVTRMQRRLDGVIAERFGFDVELFEHDLVKYADAKMLATEARDLMLDPPQPWEAMPEPMPQKIVPLDMQNNAWIFECLAARYIDVLERKEEERREQKEKEERIAWRAQQAGR
jgi:hypothetical protein